jgi:Tetratricopeptide repeat
MAFALQFGWRKGWVRVSSRWAWLKPTLAIVLLVLLLPGWALAAPLLSPLDLGFHQLYDLNFTGAHNIFASWQLAHPDDPRGAACEAAGLLFSELNRLGVLEGQFYEDDHAFAARKKLAPDPLVRDRFNAALERAENLARANLARNPRDHDALFAMTLASGLRADYAALVEKHSLASLRYTRQATDWASQLLAVDPTCYDAHLATGISQYLVGSVAAPVRWILRLGGVSGDKAQGIAELRLTAEHGRYLAPFARILLAIAYVREKDTAQARQVLASLRDQFPGNPLFARELARLDAKR